MGARSAAQAQGAFAPSSIGDGDWTSSSARRLATVEAARAEAEARGVSTPERVTDNVFFDGELQQVGGQAPGYRARRHRPTSRSPRASGSTWSPRSAATLDQELAANPRVLVFGEDVGPKGGVHAVTLGLQEKFGVERVFDTIAQRGRHRRPRGRHGAGRADAGARNPVPQICRAGDRADQRLRDDALAHRTTASPRRWCCACPAASSNAATRGTARPTRCSSSTIRAGWSRCRPTPRMRSGCCARALRGNDPVLFFEHRAMLDDAWARRPWPGDDYVLPFGRAKKTREGDAITIVTWGAMVPRCEAAAEGVSAPTSSTCAR